MASSTPDRNPSTPPPAPAKGRVRKPSAKVLEAQQTLHTRTTAPRTAQTRAGATVSQLPQNERPVRAPPTAQDGLPPVSTGRGSISPQEGGNTGLGELVKLIISLKETIAQQSSIIEDVRAELATVKAEQQCLKSQNAELQETIGSLRAQLDTLSVSPPTTQTWASVASSERPAGSGTTLSRTTSAGATDKEQNRQLVIDMSRVGEGAAERVANTEAAKQAIQQGMSGVERLARASVKDFRMWRANDSTSVIKFSVEKDREAAF